MFCGTNVVHRIKWNNIGCLMCPRQFSKHYCFEDCNYKSSHEPEGEVLQYKMKVYKTYLKKICN